MENKVLEVHSCTKILCYLDSSKAVEKEEEMKRDTVEITWSDAAARVTIGQALNFTKDNLFFIAVNDGTVLTVGVEMP